MTHSLSVYALPSMVDSDVLASGTAVIIDVLRASTTIVHALESGAVEVIPCQEVEEALAVAGHLPAGEVVLGGERGGLPIDGFDLGNSPGEYLPHVLEGRTLVFTTTNGTRALHHARKARRVLVGAFVNATAIFRELVEEKHIHLLCAGTNGQIGRDDVLLAGMLVERLQREGGLPYEQNAQAITARETWLSCFALPQALGAERLEPHRLARELSKSLGGEKLTALGLQRDILDAAQIDRFQSVPVFHPETSRVRLP